MLTWTLCDLRGNALADIDQRLSAVWEGGVNRKREARCAFSYDDEAAVHAVPLARVLKVRLWGEMIFAGRIWELVKKGSARSIELRAFDPLQQLERFAIGMKTGDEPFADPAVGEGLLYHIAGHLYRIDQTDQSYILWSLMDYAQPTAAERALGVPGTGIVQGEYYFPAGPPVSILRDREYEYGKNIAEAVIELTGVRDGVDMELEPLDRTDGTLCRLNTYYPYHGRDQTDVAIYEFASGLDNCADFEVEEDGLATANRINLVGRSVDGAEPAIARVNQPESQLAYGNLGSAMADPALVELDTLREHATGLVAGGAFPLRSFTVTPALDDGRGFARSSSGALYPVESVPGQPPRVGPGKDVWFGDLVTAQTYDGPAMDYLLHGRVTDIRLTEVEGGTGVVSEVTCSPYVGLVDVAFSGRERGAVTTAPAEPEVGYPEEEPVLPEEPEEPAPMTQAEARKPVKRKRHRRGRRMR